MSIYYLAVARPDATPGCVSTTSVVEEVLRRWPEARIELPEQGEFSVRWEADALSGELFRDGQAISVQGDERHVREMVIVFRRMLGKDLTFTDAGYYGSVVVTDTMTADELHAAYKDDLERNR